MWILWTALALAAPETPERVGTPEHVETWRSAIDWTHATTEVSQWLSGYLQVDTVNPSGNEADGARYLASIAESEGLEHRIYDHGNNRASFAAWVRGSGEGGKPLCLVSHIDVVPAELDRWSFDPLSGQISDGMIYGRGALDMKGMGIAELATAVWLHRLGVPLERDVVVLAVADEEVDGMGMVTMLADHWDDIGCDTLLNEGGLGVRDAIFDGQVVHGISVAEKGNLWLRLIAEGKAGHGSRIEEGEAPGRLLEAMELLDRKYDHRYSIGPELRELLRRAGEHEGGFAGMVLKSKVLSNLLVKPKLMDASGTRAIMTNTLHLTGMGGAKNVNVLPSEVWAQYDCRLKPGVSPEEHLARLQEITDGLEGIRWEVLASKAANSSSWETPFFETIAHYATEDRPDGVAGPILSPGFTDSIFARPYGIDAYGYEPFVLSEEQILSMHGHDEAIPVSELGEGTRRMLSMVLDFAGTEEPARGIGLAVARQLATIEPGTTPDGFHEEVMIREMVRASAPAAQRPHVDAMNTARLRDWLETSTSIGEPELRLVLLANDTQLQQRMLDQLADNLDTDWAKRAYARLLDRMSVDAGTAQPFGTVGWCRDGTWTPRVDHPGHVNASRAEMMLPALPPCGESDE